VVLAVLLAKREYLVEYESIYSVKYGIINIYPEVFIILFSADGIHKIPHIVEYIAQAA